MQRPAALRLEAVDLRGLEFSQQVSRRLHPTPALSLFLFLSGPPPPSLVRGYVRSDA